MFLTEVAIVDERRHGHPVADLVTPLAIFEVRIDGLLHRPALRDRDVRPVLDLALDLQLVFVGITLELKSFLPTAAALVGVADDPGGFLLALVGSMRAWSW